MFGNLLVKKMNTLYPHTMITYLNPQFHNKHILDIRPKLVQVLLLKTPRMVLILFVVCFHNPEFRAHPTNVFELATSELK